MDKEVLPEDKELAKRMEQIIELTSGDTVVGTTGFANLLGKKWAERVILFGESARRFDQSCIVNTDLVGSRDKTVYIPKSTSHLDIDTSRSGGEGGDRDTTKLDNLSGVDCSIAANNYEAGCVVITKELFDASRVNAITQARYAIAQDLAENVDAAIATELQDTSVTNVVYGGTSATGVDGLAAGDVISTDDVADGMEQIESNNFFPKYLYLHPKQVKVFRKDPQFINASEYGTDDVVIKGKITKYMGLEVIETTNVPAYSATDVDVNDGSDQWAVDGHIGVMVGTGLQNQPVGCALVWKNKPEIGYEYDKMSNEHRIFHDQAFMAQIIQEGSISLLKTADV